MRGRAGRSSQILLAAPQPNRYWEKGQALSCCAPPQHPAPVIALYTRRVRQPAKANCTMPQPTACADALGHYLPEYRRYRVEEYAARSRGKAVAGVGHTLAGHRESSTLHCFVVGSIASVCYHS